MSTIKIRDSGLDWFDAYWYIDQTMFKKRIPLIIESETKTVEGIPSLQWHMKLSPRSPNWTNIHLCVSCDESVECIVYSTVHYKEKKDYQRNTRTIEKSDEITFYCGLTDWLYDPEMEFFSSGKMCVEFHASFKFIKKAKQQQFCDPSTWGLRFQGSENKDFKFTISNQTIEAHKLVLSVESTTLKDLFKNTNDGEPLNIPDFNLETVKAAVDFCYAQDISDFLENNEAAMDLLIFADKYDFQTLKPKLEKYLSIFITKENIGEMVKLGSKTNSKILWQACIDFVQALLNNNKKQFAQSGEIDVSVFDAKFMTAVFQQALKPKP